MSFQTLARGWVQPRRSIWWDHHLLCMAGSASFFKTVLIFVFFSQSLAQRLCEWHDPCRKLHQCGSGRPPGYPVQPELTSCSFPQAHPALPGQTHWGSHCVSGGVYGMFSLYKSVCSPGLPSGVVWLLISPIRVFSDTSYGELTWLLFSLHQTVGVQHVNWICILNSAFNGVT